MSHEELERMKRRAIHVWDETQDTEKVLHALVKDLRTRAPLLAEDALLHGYQLFDGGKLHTRAQVVTFVQGLQEKKV